MASSSLSSKAPCTTCGNKGAGIFRCEGCLQVFCRKHLNEHRDFLSHQLDEIVLEHDTLHQTTVENKDKQNNQLLIFKQINKWEKDSIVKIQQRAEKARQQVKNLTDLPTVSKELHNLAEQLQKARIDDDYVETDLRTWTTMLQKLKDDVNTSSPSIYIQEDPTQILVAKIYVSTTTVQHLKQIEKFGESFGNIRFENNRRLAIHSGSRNGTAFVRGIDEYSSGKHTFRFMLKKNSTLFTSWFDIISKLMPIYGVSDSSYSGYGWSSDDGIFSPDVEMTVDENFRDMRGQTTLEIELLLDCDNRRISYFNQRTNKRRELNVDIAKCPFPWQIRFYLFEVGDYVQFLP